jgi:hypothetical protein
VNLPVRLGARCTQGGDEPFPVNVILKNRLAPVAAIHHMINRTGIFDAQLPGHETGLTIHRVRVKTRTVEH